MPKFFELTLFPQNVYISLYYDVVDVSSGHFNTSNFLGFKCSISAFSFFAWNIIPGVLGFCPQRVWLQVGNCCWGNSRAFSFKIFVSMCVLGFGVFFRKNTQFVRYRQALSLSIVICIVRILHCSSEMFIFDPLYSGRLMACVVSVTVFIFIELIESRLLGMATASTSTGDII